MNSFSFLVLSIILINTATIAQGLNHNQTVSDSVLKYYPLEIGNKWVYERSGFPWTTDRFAKEVLDYSILANGKWYFRINNEYERIDSANADVFRYLPEGVWTLPPTLRLKEKDRDYYLAIGESDRMTLKFIKP